METSQYGLGFSPVPSHDNEHAACARKYLDI